MEKTIRECRKSIKEAVEEAYELGNRAGKGGCK